MAEKKKKRELTEYFRRADILLLAAFLLMGAGSILVLRSGGSVGDRVVISIDGEEYGTYPLNIDREIDVDSPFGHNTVTIRDCTVAVTDSDCPNHDCEGFGAIAECAQVIMCLPHRLLVRIVGQTEIDTVIY